MQSEISGAASIENPEEQAVSSEKKDKAQEEIRKKIREIIPKLEIVNGFNKDGQEFASDEDDDEDNDDEEDEGSDEEDEENMDEGVDDMGDEESDDREAIEDMMGEGAKEGAKAKKQVAAGIDDETEDGVPQEGGSDDGEDGSDDDDEDGEPAAKRQKLVSGGA